MNMRHDRNLVVGFDGALDPLRFGIIAVCSTWQLTIFRMRLEECKERNLSAISCNDELRHGSSKNDLILSISMSVVNPGQCPTPSIASSSVLGPVICIFDTVSAVNNADSLPQIVRTGDDILSQLRQMLVAPGSLPITIFGS